MSSVAATLPGKVEGVLEVTCDLGHLRSWRTRDISPGSEVGGRDPTCKGSSSPAKGQVGCRALSQWCLMRLRRAAVDYGLEGGGVFGPWG